MIFEGDVLEQLRLMPADSVNAVVSDPPYNLGIDYGYGKEPDSIPENKYLNWMKEIFTECDRLLVPGGSIIFVWTSRHVGVGNVVHVLPDGWELYHVAAWHQVEYAGDRFTGKKPAISWGPLVWIKRVDEVPEYYGPKGGTAGRDVVLTNHVRHDGPWSKVHPCPRSEKVIKHMVCWLTKVGDVVLDPFLGTGTTAFVAQSEGRAWIGVELNPEYVKIARKRLSFKQERLGL